VQEKPTRNHKQGTIRVLHVEVENRYENKSRYTLLQCLQGLPWTSQEQFSQAKEEDPPHPIAFHHEQLGPKRKRGVSQA